MFFVHVMEKLPLSSLIVNGSAVVTRVLPVKPCRRDGLVIPFIFNVCTVNFLLGVNTKQTKSKKGRALY